MRRQRRRSPRTRNAWCRCGAALLLGAVLQMCAPTGSLAAVDLTSLSLEELLSVRVSGASRLGQTIAEAPAPVTVVTAEDIRRFGYRTLVDVLRAAPGIFVTYARDYHYVGVRGFSRFGDWNSRILVLVDGHPMNEALFDSVLIGHEFPVHVDLIDRVEIVRGPGSAVHGNNAFFAVVNILTRSATAVGGTEVSAAAGTFGAYEGVATYGERLGEIEVVASGAAGGSEGDEHLYYAEFDDPATNGGVAEDLDGERYGKAFARLVRRGLALEAAWASRRKDVPTANYGAAFNDPRYFVKDEKAYLNLRFSHDLPEGLGLDVSAFADWYRYRSDFPYVADEEAIINKDFAEAFSLGAQGGVSKEFRSGTRILAGGLYRSNERLELRNEDVGAEFPYLDRTEHNRQWALFGEVEVRPATWLLVNAGVRHDQFSVYGGTTNPRLAFILQPRAGTAVKLIYGSAFRGPNTNELYYESEGFNRSNLDLKPERIRTWEAAWEQRLGQWFQATVSGYYNRISDLIVQEPDPEDGVLVYHNRDEALARGVDLILLGESRGGVRGSLALSWVKATDEETGERLPNSPEYLAKAALAVPLRGRSLHAGPELQYVGPRRERDGGEAGGYTVVNLTVLGRAFGSRLEVSGSVYNLFDADYADPVGADYAQQSIPQDGRTFRVKLTGRF